MESTGAYDSHEAFPLNSPRIGGASAIGAAIAAASLIEDTALDPQILPITASDTERPSLSPAWMSTNATGRSVLSYLSGRRAADIAIELVRFETSLADTDKMVFASRSGVVASEEGTLYYAWIVHEPFRSTPAR